MSTLRRVLFGHHKPIYEGILGWLDHAVWAPEMGNLAEVTPEADVLVVPVTLADHAAVMRRPELAGRVVVPAAAAVRLCHDKLAFNQAMIAAGFGAHIPALIAGEPPEGQYILKQREDEFGFNSRLVETAEQRREADGLMAGGRYFRQVYVAGGEERATHLLLRGGALRYQRSVIYAMGDAPYVKGHSFTHSKAVWVEATPFIDVFMGMLAAAGFTDGVCCVDHKVVAGVPLVFEINPRYGGSLGADINRYLEAYAAAVKG